jgi:hypothetical protein
MKSFRAYLSEANTQYTEVEFVCVNSNIDFQSIATKPQNQLNLYRHLKKIDGIVPYLQDWSEGDNHQRSLAVIIKNKNKNEELLKKIKLLAKQNKVEIDIIEDVSAEKLTEVERGEYDNKWIPEET